MSESAGPANESGLVTGLFSDRESAERAYRCTAELGYGASDIDVVMAEDTRRRLFPNDDVSTPLGADANSPTAAQTATAAELGGPTGGTIGIAAPVAAALGALLLVPGVGLIAAGPVAIALAAAGAVGVAGGLAGAMTHWGVPRSRLDEYERGLREGGILLAVRPRSADDSERIVRCWHGCCAATVHA